MLLFAEEIDPTLTATLTHTMEVDEEVESVTSSLDPENPCNYDATTKGKRSARTHEPMPKKESHINKLPPPGHATLFDSTIEAAVTNKATVPVATTTTT